MLFFNFLEEYFGCKNRGSALVGIAVCLTVLVKTFRLGWRVDSAELVGGLGGAFVGRVGGLPWAAVFD